MNDILRQKIKDLPTSSGVYIMYSQSGQILYIGKAKVLKNRVSQYFNAGVKTEKVARMVSKVYTFDYIITRNEVEALVLENNLIKQHKPPYNIRSVYAGHFEQGHNRPYLFGVFPAFVQS